MITNKDKAAAFDAIVDMLKGKHEFMGLRRIPTTPQRTVIDYFMKSEMICSFEDVPIYQWRICCDGNSDIESVLLNLGKRKA